jgi:hypothetical protein
MSLILSNLYEKDVIHNELLGAHRSMQSDIYHAQSEIIRVRFELKSAQSKLAQVDTEPLNIY